MKKRNCFLCFLSLLLLLGSCNDSRKIEEYLSVNTGMVMMINTKRLGTKMVVEGEFDIEPEMVLAGISSFFDKEVIKTFQQSVGYSFNQKDFGISKYSNIYFFLSEDVKKDKRFAGIFFRLSDYRRFDRFMKKLTKEKKDIELIEKEGYKQAIIQRNKIAIAWDKQVMLVTYPRNNSSRQNLQKHIASVFNLSQENCILQDENYLKMQETPSDVTFFIQPPYFKFTNEFVPTAYMNEDIAYLNAYLQFDKGQMEMKFMQFLNSDDISPYVELLNGNTHQELFSRLEEDEIVGFVNFKYNRALLPKMMKSYDFRLAIRAANLMLGTNDKELFTLSGGDATIAFFDEIKTVKDFKSVEYDKSGNKKVITTPKVIRAPGFVGEINAQKGTINFLEHLKSQGLVRKESDYYNLAEVTEFDTYFHIQREKLIITTDKRFLKKVKRRIIGDPVSDIHKIGSNYPISSYLDFDKMAAKYPGIAQLFVKQEDLKKLDNVLSKMTFYVRPLQKKSDVIDSYFSLTFDDTEKNGFMPTLQVINLLNKNITEKNKRRKRRQKIMDKQQKEEMYP